MEVICNLMYGYTNQKNELFNKCVVKHIDGDTESLFLNPAAIKNNTVLDQVMEKCIIAFKDELGNVCQETKSVIINKLAPGDINLLFLAISTATHETTEREICPICPQCKNPTIANFDVDKDLEYNRPQGVPPKQFKLTLGTREFNMEWVPYGRIKDVQSKCVQKFEEDGKNMEIHNVFTLKNEIMKLAIKSIKNGDKIESYKDLPGKVLTNLIEKYSSEVSFGVNLKININCPKCLHKWEQDILKCEVEEGAMGGVYHFFGITAGKTIGTPSVL